jgi:hypothetical protein
LNLLAYGEPINLATAKKVAAAATAGLTTRSWHGMCSSVLDLHGEVVYPEWDDEFRIRLDLPAQGAPRRAIGA